MAAASPVHATLFAYQVGFGDCFLLRLRYRGGTRRHILIDFGTTGLPENVARSHMRRVAEDIRAKVEEDWLDSARQVVARDADTRRLDVVVATHRHADHISGFSTEGASSPGEVIRALRPRVVLQPWTEAPEAPVDWEGPVDSDRNRAFAARRQSLQAMHDTAEHALRYLARHEQALPRALAGELRFVGEDNLSNRSAVENLQAMGERQEYVFHGLDPQLENEIPGVRVHVLGPPTLRQTETIRKQRSRDADEFWHFAPRRFADAGGLNPARSIFPGHPVIPGSRLRTEQRWLARRIDAANAEIMLGIVRALDRQMNNTSAILLLEAGSKKLLFPGDAQLENWLYALDSDLAPLLDDVDLYKVGHHGSLNATPKRMWKRFRKKGKTGTAGRLTSVLSTRHGKHGSVDRNTEVPRRTLVAELEAQSTLLSTEGLGDDELYHQVELDLR